MIRPFTILVLTDDPFLREHVESVIHDNTDFIAAGPFPSNEEALNYLAQARPDAAVLDFIVDEGTCVPIARRLIGLSVPFLVASSIPRAMAWEPVLQKAPWIEQPYGELDQALKHCLAAWLPSSPATMARVSITPNVPQRLLS